MSTKKDDETRTILKNLLILIILFYLVQYIGEDLKFRAEHSLSLLTEWSSVCLILAASFNLWSYQPSGTIFCVTLRQ